MSAKGPFFITFGKSIYLSIISLSLLSIARTVDVAHVALALLAAQKVKAAHVLTKRDHHLAGHLLLLRQQCAGACLAVASRDARPSTLLTQAGKEAECQSRKAWRQRTAVVRCL